MYKACMSTCVCVTLQLVYETFYLLKIRERLHLPQLKAIVQYKGKLSKEYRNVKVYEVICTHVQLYNSYLRWSSSHNQPVLLL